MQARSTKDLTGDMLRGPLLLFACKRTLTSVSKLSSKVIIPLGSVIPSPATRQTITCVVQSFWSTNAVYDPVGASYVGTQNLCLLLNPAYVYI